MTVYKYCDVRGVDILNMLRIKVTQPEEFNDPFEFMPRIVGELSEAQAEEMFADEEFVRRQFEVLESRGGSFPGGYGVFRELFAQPSISSSDLRHVRVERADLDDTHFALVFRPA